MSTTTWDNLSENGNSNNNPIKIIVPIMLVFGLILGMAWYYMGLQTTYVVNEKYILEDYVELTPSQIRIIEIVSGHAWTQHGDEASKALDCLGRRGSTKSLKTKGFQDLKKNKEIPTFVWLCLDIDGSWYAVVTTQFIKDVSNNNVARLVTAYKISRDLFPEIGDYLMYIGEKWGASYISYIIGAGQIFIQPK